MCFWDWETVVMQSRWTQIGAAVGTEERNLLFKSLFLNSSFFYVGLYVILTLKTIFCVKKKIYLVSCISFWIWAPQRRFRSAGLGSCIQGLSCGWAVLTHVTGQTVAYGGRWHWLLGNIRGAVLAPARSLQQHGASPQAHCCVAVALLCIFFSCPLFPGAGGCGDGFTNWEGGRQGEDLSILRSLLFSLSLQSCISGNMYLSVKSSALIIC